MKIITTKSIREHKPCYDPIRHLAEDWSGSVVEFLKQGQIPAGDRTWVARLYVSDAANRLFACWCAEQSFKLQANVDQRSLAAVGVARRFALGAATDEELSAAWSAADSASESAAWSARSAADSAAW